MRKTGNGTYRVIGTEQALFIRRQNRGTNGSSGRPELHYKRKGRLQRKGGSEKERKRRDFLEKRTISKVVVKRKKTLREK